MVGGGIPARAVVDYLRAVADRMGLRDWRIDVSLTPAGEEYQAAIQCTGEKRVAVVRLAHDFRKLDPEEQRHALVHELVHVHFHGSVRALHALKVLVGEPAFHVAAEAHELAEEQAVDALAWVIASGMPMPPWCEGAAERATGEQAP